MYRLGISNTNILQAKVDNIDVTFLNAYFNYHDCQFCEINLRFDYFQWAMILKFPISINWYIMLFVLEHTELSQNILLAHAVIMDHPMITF